MRAASTASGASIRGSTAPPRAATRRDALGGSATPSTHGEDEHHAAQDRRSRGLASRRARSGRLAEPRRCAYVRHHGAADRPRRRPAGCLVCDVARHAAAQRDGPDVPADERIPSGAVAEADARQIDRGTESARARFPPCARGEGLDLSGTALMLDAVSARSFRPPAPIPREQRLGIVGLIRALRDNPLETWTAPFFEQLVVTECLPFGRAIAISDPGAIERVLLDNAANYRKDTLQRRIISKGLSNGLLTAEDEQWRVQRRTLAPLFSRRRIQSFAPTMMQVADTYVARWSRRESESIDMAAEMTRVTLDVLQRTIFSDGLGHDIERFRSAMRTYFDTIGRIDPFDMLGLPDIVPRWTRLSVRGALRFFDNAVDTIIANRRKRLADNSARVERDILTLLLEAHDPETGRGLGEREVKANIITFIAAGHETTANALAWSRFLLSQSPEWSRRVAAEAERYAAVPAESAADRMIETRAVVEEALRLYPSLP